MHATCTAHTAFIDDRKGHKTECLHHNFFFNS